MYFVFLMIQINNICCNLHETIINKRDKAALP